MAKRCLVFVALLTMIVSPAAAQDARSVLQAASRAMGDANIEDLSGIPGLDGWAPLVKVTMRVCITWVMGGHTLT